MLLIVLEEGHHLLIHDSAEVAMECGWNGLVPNVPNSANTTQAVDVLLQCVWQVEKYEIGEMTSDVESIDSVEMSKLVSSPLGDRKSTLGSRDFEGVDASVVERNRS